MNSNPDLKLNLKLKLKIIEKYGGQWRFAAAVGEHESTVSKIIRGQKDLPENKRSIWSKALGCKPEEIFN